MPTYNYKCLECNFSFEKHHSINEKEEECTLCGKSDCLTRLPYPLNIVTCIDKATDDVKRRVEEKIAVEKEDLNKYKQQEGQEKIWVG